MTEAGLVVPLKHLRHKRNVKGGPTAHSQLKGAAMSNEPSCASLADEIRSTSVQLHWFTLKPGAEQNQTAEYLSLLLHNMREHGEDVSVQPPLIGD
jgi:hypothetical protein